MSRAIRPIRIEGDVAYVPLTKGYEAVIDASDLGIVGRFAWSTLPKAHTIYAQRKATGINGERRTVRLHRAILNAQDGELVDHVDGNGLNNRRSNLRICNSAQSAQNRGRKVTNKSGYKGVYWFAKSQKWRAIIGANGKKHHLGCFGCKTAAAVAYVAAAKRLHGEFARDA